VVEVGVWPSFEDHHRVLGLVVAWWLQRWLFQDIDDDALYPSHLLGHLVEVSVVLVAVEAWFGLVLVVVVGVGVVECWVELVVDVESKGVVVEW